MRWLIAALSMATLLVGCTGHDRATPTSSKAVVDISERPEVPSERLLNDRKDQLSAPEWPELRGTIESGDDWSGQVSGTLFAGDAGAIWRLCRSVNESFPPQCGGGLTVELASVPAGQEPRFGRREDGTLIFENVRFDGVLFGDSLVFREDPGGFSAQRACGGPCAEASD